MRKNTIAFRMVTVLSIIWLLISLGISVKYALDNLPWTYTNISYMVHCKNGNTYTTNSDELGYANQPQREYDPSTEHSMSDQMAEKCGYQDNDFIHSNAFVLHVTDDATSLFTEKTIHTVKQVGSYTEDILVSVAIFLGLTTTLFFLRRIIFYVLFGESIFTKPSRKDFGI